MTTNVTVTKWIEEMKALLNPDKIVWITGEEAQLEALREEACSTGEMLKLNEEKLPGCYLHRTRPNDVARVEDRTLIFLQLNLIIRKLSMGNIYSRVTGCWEPR